MNDWINIEDGYPQEGVPLYICLNPRSTSGYTYVTIGFYMDHAWYSSFGKPLSKPALQWMPYDNSAPTRPNWWLI